MMKNNAIRKTSPGLSIGYVGQRTGLAASAIRFYEDAGLVRPERDAGGRRVFSRGDVRRLSFVLIAQRLGFSLAEIREVLAGLPKGRNPTRADWTRLATGFRAEIDARIEGLSALRARLDGCIGCGCLSLDTCAIYNPQDAAAAKGAGPRYLMGDRPDPGGKTG